MVGKGLAVGLGGALVILGLAIWPDVRTSFVRENLAMPTSSQGYGQAQINFSDVTVSAKVPLSADLQAKGLGGRTGLSDREGMLWLYDQPGAYVFWMKDMLIPLDFIWINRGQIVDLTPDVPPPQPGQSDLPIYRASSPVDAILEVRAGFIAAHNLEIGEAVTIDRQ